MSIFTNKVSIVVAKGVAYVNNGSDIDGVDLGRVCRNLIANATGKTLIACHTKAAGKDLGNRFTAAEFEDLIAEYEPCLRTSWGKTKSGGSFPSPYMSLVAKDTPKPAAKAKAKGKSNVNVVD